MGKNDLSGLSGIELFEHYTMVDNDYKAVLFQAYTELGDKLFDMLEQAEKLGKKIVIREDDADVLDSPITITIE